MRVANFTFSLQQGRIGYASLSPGPELRAAGVCFESHAFVPVRACPEPSEQKKGGSAALLVRVPLFEIKVKVVVTSDVNIPLKQNGKPTESNFTPTGKLFNSAVDYVRLDRLPPLTLLSDGSILPNLNC